MNDAENPLNFIADKRNAPAPFKTEKLFNVVSEKVLLKNRKENINLSGVFSHPAVDYRVPVALLVSGSGPNNRDEITAENYSIMHLSDFLSRAGVATLRMDKRGVGESAGDYNKATTENFAEDAYWGVEYLKTVKEIDKTKIGIIGHSEGGVIATMVAAKDGDVGFVVLMASLGTGDGSNTLLGTALNHRADGVSEKLIKIQQELAARIIKVVKLEKNNEVAKGDIQDIIKSETGKLTEDEKKWVSNLYNIGMWQGMYKLLSPAVRFITSYDPQKDLSKLNCPVLVLHGENDTQLPCRENVSAIEGILRGKENLQYMVKTFPGLNHLFQESRKGSISEYPQLEKTIPSYVFEAITDWITKLQ